MDDMKRREIIDTIVSKLSATGEFPGGVVKIVMSPADLSEFPAASVVGGNAPYTPLTMSEYTSGTPAGIDGWNIHVVTYVRTATDVDRTGLLVDEMERITEIVVKTLLADPNLGLSYVRGVYLAEISPIYDWEQNIGIVETIWQVKYDFEKGNP